MTKRISKGILCFITLMLAFSSGLSAHPSISIVVDSMGNIYYSDLQNVWVIRTDGTKEIAVANVHTHELWLSPEDVLYGEDVANQGDEYRHRVWALHPEGTLSDAIPWREGHPTKYSDYSFIRDGSGRSYVLLRNERRIDIYRNDVRENTISLKEYSGALHWHFVKEETISVAIGGKLVHVDLKSKTSSIIATDLIEKSEAFDFVGVHHALMGMWPDKKGNIYVAVFSGQKVKRISGDGEVTTIFSSEDPWSVTGGTFDSTGALLLLEWSTSNQVRIRRIAPDGTEVIL